MEIFPARVHVILARDVACGIIIRRGPSRSVCTMGWDREQDKFQLGQWLRGRIYERRSDVSPDGKHFIYFARNGKGRGQVKESWTAISRAPDLKAIGLWSNGSTWNGGGLFMSNTSYWMNTPGFLGDHEAHLTPRNLREYKKFPFHKSYGGECPGVYYIRLQRDGWRLLHHFNDEDSDGVSTFEKPLPGDWVLRKISHATLDRPPGRGSYYDTHSLIQTIRGITLDFPEWEWADWDRERIVWIDKGVLFSAALDSDGLSSIRSLYDFNPMTFENIRRE